MIIPITGNVDRTTTGADPGGFAPVVSFCAPCMGNNLAVKVRYALGSRER